MSAYFISKIYTNKFPSILGIKKARTKYSSFSSVQKAGLEPARALLPIGF
jgi:hypothetical protein